MGNNNNEKSISLNELCRKLGISAATGRNWIRLGKITPDIRIDDKPFFGMANVRGILAELENGSGSRLRSRRNKNFIDKRETYLAYLPDGVKEVLPELNINKEMVPESVYVIADACINMFGKRLGLGDKLRLNSYLADPAIMGIYAPLIDDLLALGDNQRNSKKSAALPDVINMLADNASYPYIEGADIAGYLYMSLENLGNRKARGAYFTPAYVVRRLIDELDIGDRDEVMDPCCGSGNFLIGLGSSHPLHLIKGWDIDPVSVAICRINLALKYLPDDISVLYENIQKGDFLTEVIKGELLTDTRFVIGNPPWGYAFDDKAKAFLKKNFTCAGNKAVESYDIFLEACLGHMQDKSILSFLLPEALLSVSSHQVVLDYIMNVGEIRAIAQLGDIFHKVQCPCAIVSVQKGHDNNDNEPANKGIKVSIGNESYVIKRHMDPSSFNYHASDMEQEIINRMLECDHEYLRGNAVFALGIVTGDNEKFIKDRPFEGSEAVLKGRDLGRFTYKEPSSYIKYEPDKFQQCAKTEYYRAAEKLLYKFIAKKPVFAYDNNMTLSLNSCNILIPGIEGMSIRYVCAVLNSRPVSFYYAKRFRSVKILRSHIEEIPIPKAGKETQTYLEGLTYKIAEAKEEELEPVFDEIDSVVARLYGLSGADADIACGR